jgi:hypothetical protein
VSGSLVFRNPWEVNHNPRAVLFGRIVGVIIVVAVVAGVQLIEIGAVAIGEGQTMGCTCSASESVDAVLDFVGHRQLGPVRSVETSPTREAVKIVTPLLISRWSESDCTDGPGYHQIVVFFMCLHVLTILNSTVRVIVDVESYDDAARPHSLRDAETVWKGVEPENAKHNHLSEHFGGKLVEGGDVVGATRSLLHGMDTSFDIWDMFVLSTNVQFRSEVGSYGAPSAFEFAVSKDIGDSETSFLVYAMDIF